MGLVVSKYRQPYIQSISCKQDRASSIERLTATLLSRLSACLSFCKISETLFSFANSTSAFADAILVLYDLDLSVSKMNLKWFASPKEYNAR